MPNLKSTTALFLIMLLFSCTKEELASSVENIIGQNFDSGLKIDGHQYDGLLIENCTFTNNSLRLGNVTDVLIRNCTFEDIGFDGIKLGFIGEVSNIIIEDCTFKNIGFNGVDSHERAPNCTIRNCYFENIALSEVGAALAQPHHGIYWKGKNVDINGNTFVNGSQPFGNAISVRSSGKVRNNTIFNPAKNGIMYFANHPGNDSLIIENNFVVNPNFYSIICASDGNLSNHNENVIIRFNSTSQSENQSIYIAGDFETTTSIQIYGNLFVNSTADYFRTFYDIDSIFSNLTSTTDVGFVNASEGDLHLTSTSAAIGFCDGLGQFPSTDIDGEVRTSINLDAGADERN
ncbi:MAG: right-handed parallel beta-helix repeat-containing protein [Crocinitomicaceae bacterium]